MPTLSVIPYCAGALVLLSPLIAGTFFGVNAVFGLLTGKARPNFVPNLTLFLSLILVLDLSVHLVPNPVSNPVTYCTPHPIPDPIYELYPCSLSLYFINPITHL